MRNRLREDRTVTLVCFGVSGLALVVGMWIAASPLASAARPELAGMAPPVEASR